MMAWISDKNSAFKKIYDKNIPIQLARNYSDGEKMN